MHKTVLILLTLTLHLYGCLWIEGTTIEGDYVRTAGYLDSTSLRTSMNSKPEEVFTNRYYDLNKSSPIYQAVKLVMESKSSQAIDLLLKYENTHSGLYETAVNLGTAYELEGNNTEASRWIEEGIQRNPQSHYGTEWLHLLILQNKIALETNASTFSHERMIRLPERFSADTKISIAGHEYTVREVQHAITYQLHERLVFVKPKDLIVSELLYTLAKIHEETTILEEAEKIFELSLLYGFSDPQLIEDRLHHYDEVYTQSKIKYILYGIVGFVLLFLYYSKRKPRPLEKERASSITAALFINVLIIIYTMLGLIISSQIEPYMSDHSELMRLVKYIISAVFIYLGIRAAVSYISKKAIIENRKAVMVYTILLFGIFVYLLIYRILGVETVFVLYSLFLVTMLYWILRKYFVNEENETP